VKAYNLLSIVGTVIQYEYIGLPLDRGLFRANTLLTFRFLSFQKHTQTLRDDRKGVQE